MLKLVSPLLWLVLSCFTFCFCESLAKIRAPERVNPLGPYHRMWAYGCNGCVQRKTLRMIHVSSGSAVSGLVHYCLKICFNSQFFCLQDTPNLELIYFLKTGETMLNSGYNSRFLSFSKTSYWEDRVSMDVDYSFLASLFLLWRSRKTLDLRVFPSSYTHKNIYFEFCNHAIIL